MWRIGWVFHLVPEPRTRCPDLGPAIVLGPGCVGHRRDELYRRINTQTYILSGGTKERRNEGSRGGSSESDPLTQRAVAETDSFLETLASSMWRTRSLKSIAARVGTNAIRQQVVPDDVKEKSNNEKTKRTQEKNKQKRGVIVARHHDRRLAAKEQVSG